MEKFEVSIEEVKSVQTFKRKNGSTGQKIKASVPDIPEYSFQYECCDVDEFDFSILEKGKRYIALAVPILRLENCRCADGKMRYLNIPSYKLVGITGDID